MKKVLNCKKVAGSRKSSEPRLVGSIVSEMLQVWNPNTHLGVDLKTLLRSDSKMKAGKDYQGILRRDEICEEFRYDEHFTFVETLPRPLTSAIRRSLGESTSQSPDVTTARIARTSDP